LRFREIIKNWGFGGRWIPEVYVKPGLPPEGIIAETWEVCCRPKESSEITNGELRGTTLAQLVQDRSAELLGTEIVKRFGPRFPLLIKFLDVTNSLGEQAHPDDEAAAQLGLSDPGKTEAWYMLKVKDGATIHCGNTPGVTIGEVTRRMVEGTTSAVMPEHRIKPGDSFLLYGGTMHYSRGGALLYEVMQNSEAHTNLRKPPEDISDEDLKARIHRAECSVRLEDGSDFRTEPVTLREGRNRRGYIYACNHFLLERLDLAGPYVLRCDGRRFYVLTQIEGASRVECEGAGEILEPGNTCLLPACLGDVTIAPRGKGSVLKTCVPDLTADIIEPLREAGIKDEKIARLGGRTRRNVLPALLGAKTNREASG
jgi:mannose-6-phosphate isomerase